jgi:hypothetical protein
MVHAGRRNDELWVERDATKEVKIIGICNSYGEEKSNETGGISLNGCWQGCVTRGR